MNIIKAYSVRSFYISILVMMLLCAIFDVAIFFGLEFAFEKLRMARAGATSPELETVLLKSTLNQIGILLQTIKQYYIPITGGLFLLFSLIIWGFSKRALSGLLKGHEAIPPKAPAQTKSLSEAEKKEQEVVQKRLFLHMISVLQREGRLMDFFSENLDQYEDDQIGAAVRNIHENCVKAMGKYVKTQPVLSGEEGDEITVEPDFDPGMIKLTGNIAGDPPFKGVIRHRGWKADQVEMPTLSAKGDPTILAPAEVEVL